MFCMHKHAASLVIGLSPPPTPLGVLLFLHMLPQDFMFFEAPGANRNQQHRGYGAQYAAVHAASVAQQQRNNIG